MQATGQGDEEMVRLLLARGAEVNAVDKQGQTALHRAVRHRDYVYGRERRQRALRLPEAAPCGCLLFESVLAAWNADWDTLVPRRT